MVQRLALKDSFVNDRFVPKGMIVEVPDKFASGANFGDPGKVVGGVVEIAAIAPTGPNPKMPQQKPNDTYETVEGIVNSAGQRLVGEVTIPAEERLAEIRTVGDTSPDVASLMEDDGPQGNNDDDALVAGTVADLAPTIEGADAETLDRLEAAEKDREKPRAGVLNAIEARRAALAEA